MGNSTLRPDLVVGLVGAAGTELGPVKQQLKAQFASFDYEYADVKLSHLIAGLCQISVNDLAEDERIRLLMDGGDKIRSVHGEGDGVVCLAVTAIRKIRGDRPASGPARKPYIFVIDSLKNPKEIQTLDAVYGKNFFTISVYSSVNDRTTRLANRIAETCVTNVREEHRKRAETIIDEDENRGRTGTFQDVRNTFPKADFFIAANSEPEVHVKRFVELIFGEPFITPTLDEYAMFLAKASAFRSADLSRQVGAVIIGKSGEVVSTGCNDVPYPGGGMFFEGRTGPDNRDHTVEFDPNSSEISNIFIELVSAFKQANILSDVVKNKNDGEIVSELLHGEWKDLTIDARVRNLIEFGRVVHAEMHAISEAARLGRPISGLDLYCTTFPCHICARHVTSSGIKQVIFIEPYPKSLTKSL